MKRLITFLIICLLSFSTLAYANMNGKEKILNDKLKEVEILNNDKKISEMLNNRKALIDSINEEKNKIKLEKQTKENEMSAMLNTINENKQIGKILIYHSHTLEEYADGTTVVDAGNDLTSKLIELGFEVDNVMDNFSFDYNNAYSYSRNYLQGLDLSQYDLIIDMHRDAASSRLLNNIDGTNYSIVKFVFSVQNVNYSAQKQLADKISSNMSDIYSEDFNYDFGILDFNQDLDDSVLLIENGYNSNESEEIYNSNTKIANAIYEALKGEE